VSTRKVISFRATSWILEFAARFPHCSLFARCRICLGLLFLHCAALAGPRGGAAQETPYFVTYASFGEPGTWKLS